MNKFAGWAIPGAITLVMLVWSISAHSSTAWWAKPLSPATLKVGAVCVLIYYLLFVGVVWMLRIRERTLEERGYQHAWTAATTSVQEEPVSVPREAHPPTQPIPVPPAERGW